MAGVGKTSALIALGHDKDVRDHFKDGVLYLQLGAKASVKDVTRGLFKIMRFTEARASADTVHWQTDLTIAVDDAALWFMGKVNLFVIDDLWSTSSCDKGFLPQFRNILEGSSESRIVLATRNVLIGSSASSHVDFDARNPLGPISRSMFIGYATNRFREVVSREVFNLVSVQGILRLCAGLPIALAVTGCFVSRQVSSVSEFESVCNMYLKQLEAKTKLRASIVESAISLSVGYLDSALQDMPNPSSQMYTSLCILKKQHWIPVCTLAKLWGVGGESAEHIAQLFSSMSLVRKSVQKTGAEVEEVGLSLHDLHHDFCLRRAEGGTFDEEYWYDRCEPKRYLIPPLSSVSLEELEAFHKPKPRSPLFPSAD